MWRRARSRQWETSVTDPGRELVWITGARGFIGRHVARACAASGARVAGLGHGAWRDIEAQPWGVSEWLNGDITGSNLGRLAESTGLPTAVIHLAGGSAVGAAIEQPREDFFRTVTTTMELIEWLRIASPATAVVAVSSAAVYGAGHPGLIVEDAPATPYSPYGHHKLMMESLCRSYGATYGLRAVVARLFSVYGPGLTKQLLWDSCSKLRSGSRLLLGGSGAELRDWVHVDDVARVLCELPARARPDVPVFNVGTGRSTPVADIAMALISAWRRIDPGYPDMQPFFNGRSRPGDPFSLVADPRSLAALGLRCERSVEQGIVDYVGWYSRFQGNFA